MAAVRTSADALNYSLFVPSGCSLRNFSWFVHWMVGWSLNSRWRWVGEEKQSILIFITGYYFTPCWVSISRKDAMGSYKKGTARSSYKMFIKPYKMTPRLSEMVASGLKPRFRLLSDPCSKRGHLHTPKPAQPNHALLPLFCPQRTYKLEWEGICTSPLTLNI